MAKTLERWLQIAAAVYCGHCMSLYAIVFLLPFLLLLTRLWWLTLIAALWMWYDKETPHRGGRRGGFFVTIPLLKYLNGYFPVKLVPTADLDPKKNYLFIVHPHGVFTAGSFCSFGHAYSLVKEHFPQLTFYATTAEINISFPIMRDYCMSWGAVSAKKKSLTYLLSEDKKGNAVTLTVGGAEEARYIEYGKYKIILDKRKGFVKIALTVGCSLVPVIIFGENDIYEIKNPKPGTILSWIQIQFKKFTGILWVIPSGPYWFVPLLARSVPLTTVVGKPIELPKIAKPTQEQIDHYHEMYKKQLIALFEEQKHKYVQDPESTHLEIVA